MKIALLGYGKMGKIIHRIAEERGHEIVATFHKNNPVNLVEIKKCDVAIEFSRPELALPHIDLCLTHQIPLVVGTTGWYNHLDEVEDCVRKHDGSLLWASNFSIGVNIFFQVNALLSQLMVNKGYSAEMEEIHHTEKLDAPSGTAISLAQPIIKDHNLKRFETLEGEFGESRIAAAIHNQTLPIVAKRLPDVPGTHQIKYQSDVDQITITHEAKNREGFALGAVVAAEYLQGKKGIFTMRDVLNIQA